MQTAVVTGAGRGIGREIARVLAERDFVVLVTDVDEALAAETARQCGEGAWSLKLDVRDPEAHAAAAAAARERGPVAVWVNNAAVLRTGHAWDHPQEDIRLLIDTNVLGVIHGSRAAVEAMPEGGDIVNVASLAAFATPPGMAVYSATKHAVLGFSLALRADLERSETPVRVHVLCPGAVDTEMV
ncbi:MAG: SDR family oxidoreductase, partial [Actinomycetota bacterium]|nr:SDR family oxidoreductase [Actinomycetota bacterium]